jgi:hypothetical protein
MPLWKLQTVGRVKEDFLYPNTGRGREIRMRGDVAEAVARLARAWQAYAPMAMPAGREVGVIV